MQPTRIEEVKAESYLPTHDKKLKLGQKCPILITT